jgi:hypothetical protein
LAAWRKSATPVVPVAGLIMALLFVPITLIATPTISVAAAPGWFRDQAGCEIWVGALSVSLLDWQGACREGRAEGAGRLAAVFRRADGLGNRELSCNCVATDGRVVGEGSIQGPGFGRYEGDLANGVPDGRGTRIYKSGERYEGGWRDGSRHGEGEVTSPRGWLYRGVFAKDVFSGHGRSEWRNGDWHEGAYLGGLRHGRGTYASPTAGWRYEGDFVKGVREGEGTLFLETGHRFMGVFKNGKPDGKGVCVDPASKKRGACRYTLGRFKEWLE